LDDQRPLGYAPRVIYRPAVRVRARALLEISSSGMIFCISQVGVGDWFFPQVDG
jgi:hypothetical protein